MKDLLFLIGELYVRNRQLEADIKARDVLIAELREKLAEAHPERAEFDD